MPDISKIKLPSGTTYDIKDSVARSMIGGAIIIRGSSKTPLSDNATTNPIQLDDGTTTGQEYTAVANDAVFYGDGEFIFDGTKWHRFGDMSGIGEMGKVDQGTVTIKPKGSNAASAVSFGAHTTDNVLGEATTFKNAASSVSFAAHTTANVLKSTVTATVPKTSATTKYLSASASVATSGNALTGLGSPTTTDFVTSYPGASSKLVTTSVTGVSGSVTASKATAGTAVAVAKAGTAVSGLVNGLGAAGTETDTRGANTPMWGAQVEDETLHFTWKPFATTSVTPAVSNGNITPYTFADVTVPKAAAATTVATGSLASNGGGGTVMTGLGTANKAAGVTGYTPTSDTFAKTVSASLSSATSTSTGAVKYVEAIGTSGTDAVTFADGHTVDVITTLGAGTAAAQTITVGTNDKVAAITALGAGTAAAQTFTGTQETYDVNPKTS